MFLINSGCQRPGSNIIHFLYHIVQRFINFLNYPFYNLQTKGNHPYQHNGHKQNCTDTGLVQFTGGNAADNVIIPVRHLLINVKPSILVKAALHAFQFLLISGVSADFINLSGCYNHAFCIYQFRYLP